MIGTVQRREWGGRPENVYCLNRIPAGSLEHDDRLTDVFEALGWPEAERTPRVAPVPAFDEFGKVTHQTYPDARTPYPKPRWWEMHCGTEERGVIEKKVAAYRGKERGVLFVVLTEHQRKTIFDWCKPISDVLFVAVFDELLANPTGPVWMTSSGAMRALDFMPRG